MKVFSVFISLRLVLCFWLLVLSAYSFSFGILLTSPQDRIKLDRMRGGLNHSPPSHYDHSNSRNTKVIEFDGLVKRRQGPNTIWVNGTIMQKPSVAGVSIDANKLVESAAVLKLPSQTNPLLIKPGQRFRLDEGNVSESYNSMKQASVTTIEQATDGIEGLPLPEPLTESSSGME